MMGFHGKIGKGVDEVINIPPMDLKKYGKLPYGRLKLFKFRLRGLEEMRAGSFLQYNLLQNKHIVSVLVDFPSKECWVATEKLEKDEVQKLIHEAPTYTASPDLKYDAILEDEETIDYTEVLKKRFNLEFID